MKLYNTATKQVEEIKPQHSPKVTIYTCGPTVYDYPHIGNWFTFIRYDLLIRTLKAAGLKPVWVMNITDVGHLVSDADEGEDRLEKGARREGKTAWDVAKFYGDYFVEGLKRLNITTPDYLPRATDHIQEQIELVKKLEDKGCTYVIDDGVYYDTSKFSRYRDLAQLDLDEQQAGARIEHNPQKRNTSDFALWKFSPKDRKRDMEWDSPWGKGFPGWHIECSAMSMKYLGETLDIHAGGIDHLPVHHTNEIAQSEAVTGKPFAHYWMHTNHITVEGEKISKSLGNSITLEDIAAKGFSPEVLRLHVLESHYRSQSKFSWEALQAAQNRLKRFQNIAALRYQIEPGNGSMLQTSELKSSLDNDLNSPQALLALETVVDQIEERITTITQEAVDTFISEVDASFGLQLSSIQDISEAQKELIASREKARIAKDWQKSDAIRRQLMAQGIGLRDTPNSTIWYY